MSLIRATVVGNGLGRKCDTWISGLSLKHALVGRSCQSHTSHEDESGDDLRKLTHGPRKLMQLNDELHCLA